VHTTFQLQNLKERDHLRDVDVAVRRILKWTLEKWDVSWIQIAEEKGQWHAVVNTIMNHWVGSIKRGGASEIAERLLAFKDVLCHILLFSCFVVVQPITVRGVSVYDAVY
jgi:hypothetical protein